MTTPDPIYPSLIPQADLDAREHQHWAGLWNEDLCARIEQGMVAGQHAWAGKDKDDISLSFPAVQSLYKYRTFDPDHPDRTRDLFAGQKLWSASLPSINDPMEGAFRSPADAMDAHAAFAFVYMMRSPWCGCISFSFDPVSSTMWSHYAGDHRGFVIKYNRLESMLLCSPACAPVMYRAVLPDISMEDPGKLQHLVDTVFWTKSQTWEHEREWRLRYPRIDAYTHPGLIPPAGVIFGLKTPPDVRAFIRASAPDLQFGEVTLSGHDYRLQVIWEEEDPMFRSKGKKKAGKAGGAGRSKFDLLLDMAIDIAIMQLDEVGEFNPFGIIMLNGEAQVLMVDPDRAFREGIPGNQISRMVEDMIREARARDSLEFAALVYDANLRPVEGGSATSAIVGRLEERGGQCVQFIQEYAMRAGRAHLGSQRCIDKPHHLLP